MEIFKFTNEYTYLFQSTDKGFVFSEPFVSALKPLLLYGTRACIVIYTAKILNYLSNIYCMHTPVMSRIGTTVDSLTFI